MAEQPIAVETGYEDGIVDTPEQIEEARSAKENVSLFDQLAASLSQDAAPKPITVPIPGRPNLSLRMSCEVDSERLAQWTRRATEKRGAERGVNQLRLSCMILVNQCTGLVMNGQVVTNEHDETVRLNSPQLAEMLGLPEHADRVAVLQKLFGSDGHIFTASQKVLDAAGYGDDIDTSGGEENPTN